MQTKPVVIPSLPRVLPIEYGPKMARRLQGIAERDPKLAQAIRSELFRMQESHRRLRSLLARDRLAARRVPLLPFRRPRRPPAA